MKKKYIIPTLEVIQTETEALLEASLELIDENANGDGMSRGEMGIFFNEN